MNITISASGKPILNSVISYFVSKTLLQAPMSRSFDRTNTATSVATYQHVTTCTVVSRTYDTTDIRARRQRYGQRKRWQREGRSGDGSGSGGSGGTGCSGNGGGGGAAAAVAAGDGCDAAAAERVTWQSSQSIKAGSRAGRRKHDAAAKWHHHEAAASPSGMSKAQGGFGLGIGRKGGFEGPPRTV